MDENTTPKNQDIEGNDDNDFVYLSDEDGNEYPFEFLDVITYDDEEYAVFFPAYEENDDADDESVVILKVIQNDDGSADFVSIDDTNKLDAVFEIFMENMRRSFESDGKQD